MNNSQTKDLRLIYEELEKKTGKLKAQEINLLKTLDKLSQTENKLHKLDDFSLTTISTLKAKGYIEIDFNSKTWSLTETAKKFLKGRE